MTTRKGKAHEAKTANMENDHHTGLRALFEHQLADLYYVEKQLLQELPRMAEKVVDEELQAAFDEHRDVTEKQVERLERIFELIGKPAKAKRCEAIDGILKEAKSLMSEFEDDPALDAALACAAQKVEHYEITSYGSLCAFAEELGLDQACDLIEDTLDEEKDADERLSSLAESALNIDARAQETMDEQEAQPTRRKAEPVH